LFVCQKYNADYDLSAREGADTLAFTSLLEEKLLPALVRLTHTVHTHTHMHACTHTHTHSRVLMAINKATIYLCPSCVCVCVCMRVCVSQIYTFWVECKNYVEVTRRWYAEHMPFPLSLFLPSRMQASQQERLRLVHGDHALDTGEELEKEVGRGQVRGQTSGPTSGPTTPLWSHHPQCVRSLPVGFLGQDAS